MDKHQLIIDCDPGIDDALALFLAAGSPELELLAVTTVAGNRPVDITAANARRLLDLAGKHEVPVHGGAARPLGHGEPRCNLVHGEDGLGGVALAPARERHPAPAAQQLVELLLARPPHSVNLVAIGPLTNLAMAEMLAPGILARARQLLVMGGALRCPGNITSAAEFNFYADPVAADMVMRAGANLVLFPLDVTHKAVMAPEWIALFGELPGACGQAAAAMLQAYSLLDPLLHDVCPVACLLQPGLFAGEACAIEVDWRNPATEGQSHIRDGDSSSAMFEVQREALLALVHAAIARLP